MGFADPYLKNKNYLDIAEAPAGLLRYIIVIPAFCEPEIIRTLQCLSNCISPRFETEVLILFNYAESVLQELKQQTLDQYNQVIQWSNSLKKTQLKFHPLLAADLPDKYAGAGLARKILMDSAVARFNKANIYDGIIISLDADTMVPNNYLSSLEGEVNPLNSCYIFNFAHPVSGQEFSPAVYQAAILYELHLRYYKQILQSTGYPFYQYTIGSCFAVPVHIYVKAGGMNKHKAGEDFYFLQKIFKLGKCTFIPDAILKPSVRPSWRVPFGTGPAIRKIINSPVKSLTTYHPELFSILKQFLEFAPAFYKRNSHQIEDDISCLPLYFKKFLDENIFFAKISEMNKNTSSHESFIKRFYNWFDGFTVIKYLNFAGKYLKNDIEVCDAVKLFLNITNSPSVLELLEILRKKDLNS